MPVADAVGGEGVRQRVPVELRRRPRARDRAHVHEQRDVDLPQERHEFGEGPRGVADGEDGMAHPRFTSGTSHFESGWESGECPGAPLRLRVENQIGFKMVKWIQASSVTFDLAAPV